MDCHRNKAVVCPFKMTKRYLLYKDMQKKIDEKLDYESDENTEVKK
jgi:hypothetical protein